MIILGNKYTITGDEKKQLLKQVKNIRNIDIKHSDDKKIVNEIKRYLESNEIEFIVLNLDKDLSIHIESYLEELDNSDVQIILFSEFTSKFFNRCHIDFNETNFEVLSKIHNNYLNEFNKRLFDIIFSFVSLLLLSPVFLIIAIMIKIKSPGGPIFFGHQRSVRKAVRERKLSDAIQR